MVVPSLARMSVAVVVPLAAALSAGNLPQIDDAHSSRYMIILKLLHLSCVVFAARVDVYLFFDYNLNCF